MAETDTIFIASSRLTARVANPQGKLYQGARFDHCGFIPSVILDGQYEFATIEQMTPGHPTSHGQGLCDMYMLDGDEESVAVGQPYLRMGAGYLKRTAKPWDFMKSYALSPLDINWEADGHSVRFVTQAQPCGGFGYRQEKIVHVESNRLTTTVVLQNTGERLMNVQTYNHNFLTLGKFLTDEKTHLALPAFVQLGQQVADGTPILFENGELRWPCVPGDWFKCTETHASSDKPLDYSWRLWREDSALSVQEHDDFAPVMAVIWGKRHVISPEMYTAFVLQPGESHKWTRTWTFDD